MRRKTKAGGIVILSLILLLTACERIPDTNFYSWMYDVYLDADKVSSILGAPNSGNSNTWSGYELIDGVSGTFKISTSYFSDNQYVLNYWSWELYTDEDTYETIKNALCLTFQKHSDAITKKDIDEMYIFQAEQFQSGNYLEAWTYSDGTDFSDIDEGVLNSTYHVIMLLKKDDKVCVQYVPIYPYGLYPSTYEFYEF